MNWIERWDKVELKKICVAEEEGRSLEQEQKLRENVQVTGREGKKWTEMDQEHV